MDVTEPILVQQPMRLPPKFAVELANEIKRLMAGNPCEVQEIYRIWPCATSRRRELLKISTARIAHSLKLKSGMIELTAICEPSRVTLELAYAKRADEMPNAPAVQDYIPLRLYFDDLGGDPVGK